jgi:DMSO/TMAO reductase YedYZ molybdopterin-dependent catalytic subunit
VRQPLPLRVVLLLLGLVSLLLGLPVLALASSSGTGSKPIAGTDAKATQSATFTIGGAVAHPQTMTVATLRTFPRHHQRVRYQTAAGAESHRFTGAALVDVLNAAGPLFDPAIKNDQLRHAVLVTASDGYQSVVSWAEIDPRFEGKEVLLAYKQDGQRLDEQGPRLTMPGDAFGGRYVTGVVSITLVRVSG